MAGFSLNGMGVALVTPFKKDKSIDFMSLENLVERLINGKSDYLVVLGTTAETPALFENEKSDIIKCIRETSDNRIPLVLGIGSNSTAHVVERLNSYNLDGFSAVLSVTPYYNRPNQEGLYLHFKTISENSSLPVILYNVPSRTSVNLKAETTLRLAYDFPNIIGIKEASGNLHQIEKIINESPEGFKVVSGDDCLTYNLMVLGAAGVISVIGNAFPEEFHEMTKLCLESRFKEALTINRKFINLLSLLFKDGNPAGVKCMLSILGFMENELRLPLTPLKPESEERLRETLAEFVEINDFVQK